MINNQPETNIFDFGAKGDAALDGTGTGTDDTNAFQAAITAWQNGYGGTLKIPALRPNGQRASYRLSHALSADVGSGYSVQDYTVDARGATFRVDIPGGAYDLFTLTNFDRLKWVGGTFFGWNGAMPIGAVPNPIHNVFNVSGMEIIDTNFLGFALNDAGDLSTAIIKANRLNMRGCAFESISNSNGKPTVLLASGWTHFHMESCAFTDFISYNNQSGSIGSAPGFALWVRSPSNETDLSVYGANQLHIKDCFFDEGSGGMQIGENNVTTLIDDFTQPHSYYEGLNPNSVVINLTDNSWVRFSDRIFIPGGGYYQVQAVNGDGHHVTVLNIGVAATGTNAAFNTNVSANAGATLVMGTYVPNVLIEGCNMNQVPSNGSIGFDFKFVRNVQLRDLWIREGNVGSKCVKGRYVDNITIEKTRTRLDNAPISAVDFDSTVGNVKFVDSHMDPTGSSAVRTTIANAPYNLSKGANVVAANDLQLAYGSSMTVVTGNTTINAIKSNTLEIGKEFFLLFTGTPLIKNDTAGGAGTVKMVLNSSIDIQPIAPGLQLGLLYNGSDVHETTRKAS